MALSVNPYAGQAQAATINPFQQRSEDPVRTTARQDSEKTQKETRPADVSAARSQDTETRNNQRRADARVANDEASEKRETQTRGSVVDIRV